MTTSSATARSALPRAKGLRPGAIGFGSSLVISLASTAPAYSIAASLGYIVLVPNGAGLLGAQAPLIIALAFVPILCIALAYRELNRAEPDCGTAFTWGTRAFGPRVGWMTGWTIVVANIIVMANLAAIAGSYTYSLMGLDDFASSTPASTFLGVLWIGTVTWISYRGLELSARVQVVLLLVELGALAAFAFVAFAKVIAGSAPSATGFDVDWWNFGALEPSAVVSGLLIAVFIYWGWDTAVTTNEETSSPHESPGRAAVTATLLLVTTYVLVAVATISFAGLGDEGVGLGNPDNADDVFAALGVEIFGGGPVGHLMVHLLVISVLTSAAACAVTTVLPAVRTTFAMASHRAIPSAFARVHQHNAIPSVATIAFGVAASSFYVLMTIISQDILADTIAALGLLIAGYYGMTGLACVRYFRGQRHTLGEWLTRGVLPLFGGLSLLTAGFWALKNYYAADYGTTSLGGVGGVFVIGVGTVALGVVVMLALTHRQAAYFAGESLPQQGAVPEPRVDA